MYEYAEATFSFDGVEADELSLREGEIVRITRELENPAWYEGELRGKTGIFPSNFARLLDAKAQCIAVATVTTDFVAANADELSLHAGDRVVLTKRVDANWLEGRTLTKTGIFPANHVKADEPQGTAWARTTFQFTGEVADELSVWPGDIVFLTRTVDADWVQGTLYGK